MDKEKIIDIESIRSDHDKIVAMEAREEVRKEYRDRDKVVCKTATSVSIAFFLWVGRFLVNNFDAVHNGFMAFITTVTRSK